MITHQAPLLEPLAKERWLRMLSDHRQSLWLGSQVRERRQQKRLQIHATTTVHFQPARSDKIVTFRNCPVLDASTDGLSIRVCHKIAPGTPLSLELSLGGKRYTLTGTVAQNSGSPGAVRVGIALQFPTPEKDGHALAPEP